MAKETVVLDSTTRKNIESWLQGEYDDKSKEEIRKLQQQDPEELLDAFYTHLSFGTGGLRGIMGVGTNRMNPYTVRSATQGLANYIKRQASKEEAHSVVIGYDCRHHSREFAEESAKVLAANGIKVYLYQELRPVALVSFGVLYKKATAGILITASHNPPQYNGYKVYWDYGGQVLPPHDQGIIEEVEKITSNEMVQIGTLDSPLIEEIDGEIDLAYRKAVSACQLHPGDNLSKGKELAVVYTSLHGAGITTVPPALKEWGFTNLTLVEEQSTPDGDFPTVKTPNPEDHAALKLGIDTLKKTNGDLLIGTDPDTDRLGVVIMHEGEPYFFNGNEMACILFEHICRSLKQKHQFPPKPMCVKTIVTTELLRKIADHYQVSCLDVLTGFKYIGEKISQWEEEKEANVTTHHFLFGGEESYGYLIGTHVRDKDAIVSSAMVCEAALQMKFRGKTLLDLLHEIYQEHGVYREKLLSLTFEGKEGIDAMKQMMETLRKHPPQTLADQPVEIIEDYLTHQRRHVTSGTTETLTLPKSNVLRLWLADGTKVVIRPSGTEPKIKLYCGLFEKHHYGNKTAMLRAIDSCDSRLETLLSHLQALLQT
ncbi:MAG: Phosphoglucomutase [Chlamydiae bacterium]|nr:Phosphoglucomutase [Chlamydiota bacterium]